LDAIWDALIGSDRNSKTIKPHQATVLVWSECEPVHLSAHAHRLFLETRNRIGLSLWAW
jgi:hypothetical protein